MKKAVLINIKIHLRGAAVAQGRGEKRSKGGRKEGWAGISLKRSECGQRHDSGRTDSSRGEETERVR